MTHIDKRQEEPGVSRVIKFLDGFGNEMPNVVAFDPVTGFGTRLDNDGEEQSFYCKDGVLEVDGVHNPTEYDMESYRLLQKTKHMQHLSQEEKSKLMHDVIQQLKKEKEKEKEPK